MVFLTMTASMVEALGKIQGLPSAEHTNSGAAKKSGIETEGGNWSEAEQQQEHELPTPKSCVNDMADTQKVENNTRMSELLLENPKVGQPISHIQAIRLSKQLKDCGLQPCNLDVLLRGAKVYVPPPPPKTEPTPEYKALMARLRREEEARSYDRMTNPLPPRETFAQRFPSTSAANAFASNFQPAKTLDPFDEVNEVTYADVDRQMAVVLNVLLSILACAGAIWVAARWWSTPARLALSFSGSLLVGVAEVAVYSGYIRRVGEAKSKERSVKEVKEVLKSWVIQGDVKKGVDPSEVIGPKIYPDGVKARRRKGGTA